MCLAPLGSLDEEVVLRYDGGHVTKPGVAEAERLLRRHMGDATWRRECDSLARDGIQAGGPGYRLGWSRLPRTVAALPASACRSGGREHLAAANPP